MSLLILHLSDIHFSADALLERARMISAAMVPLIDTNITHVIVMVSGDVAYHGTAEEYGLASDFFLTLTDDVKRRVPKVNLSYLFVPGNHDLNLSITSAVRDILVKHARDASAIQQDVIRELLSAQKDCNSFISDIEQLSDSKIISNEITSLSRLVMLETLPDVEFLLINSAWMSTIHEQQGTLRLPIEELAKPKKSHVVAMLHHPSNWIEANNARSLRTFLEESSSLILTGHEHIPLASHTRNDRGDEFLHFEGGALHAKDTQESTFYAILLDFDRGYRRFKFSRDGDIYEYAKPSDWEVLPLNSKRQTAAFAFTASFLEFLNDIAMPVKHGTIPNVKLKDIFVWPDLESASFRNSDGMAKSRLVRGGDVADLLLEDGIALVSGEEKSGKTTLAKMLMSAAKDRGLVPVYVIADKTMRNLASLRVAVLDAVDKMYQGATRQRFEQLESSQKCIIIDDIQALPLTKYSSIIDDLLSLSSRVLLLASDVAAAIVSISRPATLALARYKIKPFGHLNRNALVENWLTLSTVENPNALARKLHDITKRVDELLGRAYVPAYPMFVITMLSASEASLPLDNRISTSAYYYEIMIKIELLRDKTQYTDMYMGLLSFLAVEFHMRQIEQVSLSEFVEISDKYKKSVDLRFDSNQMLEQLVSRRMLSQKNDAVTFRYDFIFLYFVGLYFASKIRRPDIQQRLREIANDLTTSKNSDILLFVAHLSNDPFIIEQLQNSVANIFPSSERMRMQSDLPAVQYTALADAAYSEVDPLEARRKRAQDLDNTETEISDDNETSEIFGPLNAMTTAFRSMELLGQILKNYPGQLDAEIKLEIAQNIIHAGLRTLTWIVDYIHRMQQTIASELVGHFKEEEQFFDQNDAREIIEEIMARLIYLVCFGMIKRTASSIGSAELELTYEKIVKNDGSIPVKLVHAAILLDCSYATPQALVEHYRKDMAGHELAISILRDLVIEHFYLFDVDRATKQRLCQILGIRYRDAVRLSDGSHGS